MEEIVEGREVGVEWAWRIQVKERETWRRHRITKRSSRSRRRRKRRKRSGDEEKKWR